MHPLPCVGRNNIFRMHLNSFPYVQHSIALQRNNSFDARYANLAGFNCQHLSSLGPTCAQLHNLGPGSTMWTMARESGAKSGPGPRFLRETNQCYASEPLASSASVYFCTRHQKNLRVLAVRCLLSRTTLSIMNIVCRRFKFMLPVQCCIMSLLRVSWL